MGCRPLNATRALFALLGFVTSAGYAAPFVYVTQPSSIAVIDAATNSVTATLPAGGFPYAIAIARSGTQAYTADFASNTVTFIDLVGGNVMATVAVAAEPLALALSADQARLFVASRNARLSIIDVASHAVTAVVPLHDPPVALALHPDGRRLYVLYESVTYVDIFDTTTNALSGNLSNRLDVLPGGFALRASGAEIYIANAFMRSYFVPPPSDIVTVLDTNGVAPVGSISVGEQVSAVTFGSNPERAYVAAAESVKVIDPSSRAVVGSIPVAAGYSPAIAYLPAPQRLFLTSYSGNIITVIDVASASVLTTIPVEGPGYLAVAPEGAVAPPPTGGPKPAPLVPANTRPQRPAIAARRPIGWID